MPARGLEGLEGLIEAMNTQLEKEVKE